MNKKSTTKAKGRKTKKHVRAKRRFAITLALFMFVIILPLIVILSREPESNPLGDADLSFFTDGQKEGVVAGEELENKPADPKRKEGFYNFLVLGCDKGGGNTDAIMVVSFDTKAGVISTVQIPRDSYVEDADGIRSRINSVYYRNYSKEKSALTNLKRSASGKSDVELREMYDKANLRSSFSEFKSFITGKSTLDQLSTDAGVLGLQEVLKSTFGIFTDYYAIISLNSFVDIVNAVGGVDVYVQDDMFYHDPYQNLHISIPKGNQHLDGKEAEGFVRFRAGYAGADITRTNAQKIFMTAFMKKLTSPSIITKIDDIVDVVYKNVKTDVSPLNAISFVKPALKVDLSSINMMTMQGQGKTVDGAAYYALNKASNLLIVNSYFNAYTSDILGEKLNVIELVDFGDDVSTGNMTMADIEDHQPSLGFIHAKPTPPPAEEPEESELTEDEPTEDVPTEDEPKEDEPKEDEPKEDEPKEDEPTEDEPTEDEPKEDEPKEDEPKEDEPTEDEPTEDEPTEDEPTEDEPKEDEPKEDEPKEDEPSEEISTDDQDIA